MSILQNINKIQQEIKNSESPASIIVCVSKNRSIDEINEALNSDINHIAENRVQEAQKKFPFLKKSVKKHLIGHLQGNKVKKAVEIFDLIQSVDSLNLANKINQTVRKMQKKMEIFLQINISKDPAKFGFDPDDFLNKFEEISKLPNLTILENNGSDESKKNDFERMKKIFNDCKKINEYSENLKYLSMGMSSDYMIALDCGSNMIRVGSKIFE